MIQQMQTFADKQPVLESFAEMPGAYSVKDKKIGLIRIHSGAISSIVRKVVSGTEGVSRLSGSSLIDNIAELVGSKKIQERSIAINMKDNVLSIEISVNAFYGFNLPKIADTLKTQIANEILTNTGLHVSSVNVNIRDLDDVEPETETADNTAE